MYNSEYTYTVCIHCMTYNHEKYLADALEGFVMQKTDFPFVAVVIDDCSTDGTAAVLKKYEEKYPDIIKVVYLQENYYSQQKSKQPFLEPWDSKAKYIALCEGDDYWTDPLKLKKQVDYLDSHDNIVLCCHRYKIFEEKDGVWADDYVEELFKQKPNGFTFTAHDNLHTWITKTMTLLYRSSSFTIPKGHKFHYYRDVHMCYYILQKGHGYCMPDVMAVYRQHPGGVFSPIDNKQKDYLSTAIYCELFLANRHDEELRDVANANLYNYFKQYIKQYLICRNYGNISSKDLFFCIRQYKEFLGKNSPIIIFGICLKAFIKGLISK